MAKAPAPPIMEDQLRGFKYFKRLMPLMERLHRAGPGPQPPENPRTFLPTIFSAALYAETRAHLGGRPRLRRPLAPLAHARPPVDNLLPRGQDDLMPRRGRIHQQTVCYHHCTRCINRDELFHHERDDGRYIEPNPVRARLMGLAWDWPFTSAGFCALGRGDELTDTDVRYDEAGLSAEEREAYAAMLRDDEDDQWMRSQGLALRLARPRSPSGSPRAPAACARGAARAAQVRTSFRVNLCR